MRAFATAEHTHAHTNREREREREARARRHACGGTWRSLKFFSGSWRYLMSSMHTKPVTIEVVVARAGMMRPAISRACSLSTCVRRHTSISTRQRDTQTHRQADRARDRTQGQNAGRERRKRTQVGGAPCGGTEARADRARHTGGALSHGRWAATRTSSML